MPVPKDAILALEIIELILYPVWHVDYATWFTYLGSLRAILRLKTDFRRRIHEIVDLNVSMKGTEFA